MGFADEVAAAGRKRETCTVAQCLQALDAKTRKEAEEVLAGPAAGAAIARVLTARTGIRISGGTVQRHRNKGCSCDLR